MRQGHDQESQTPLLKQHPLNGSSQMLIGGSSQSIHHQSHRSQISPLVSNSKKTNLVVVLGSIAVIAAGAVFILLYFLSADKLPHNAHELSKIKPNRLKPGSSVSIISPASPYSYICDDPKVFAETLTSNLQQYFGFTSQEAQHANDLHGYLAGTDGHRVADIENGFKNQTINWLLPNRGGYGCDRVLLHGLNFTLLKMNPKIISGYSDLTALINGIHQKTGLITFYSPMGLDFVSLPENDLNRFYFDQVVVKGQMVTFTNPPDFNWTRVVYQGGKAKGKLYGGNLSVFSTLIGTEYVPSNWSNVILFLEEVEEEPYRVDRWLSQLKLQGVLDNVAGFIWGTCNGCIASEPSQALTIEQVLDHYMSQLKVPCWRGSLIGHIPEQFTLPIGGHVQIDADAGSITMLEAAVS